MDQIGIITGAGKGIGLAISTRLVEHGACKQILAISRSKSNELEELERRNDNLTVEICDITDYDKMDNIMDRYIANVGFPDFCICNAGVRSRMSIKDSELALYRNIFEVNTLAQIKSTKYLASRKERKKSLKMLYITSIVGQRGFKDLTTYAVAKSALEGFIKSAAVELAEENIIINGIAPGFVESSYTDNFRKNNPSLYQWTKEQTLLGDGEHAKKWLR